MALPEGEISQRIPDALSGHLPILVVTASMFSHFATYLSTEVAKKDSKMKIAIEAQRIFRRDKHGMDFVVLGDTEGNFRKRKDGNEYYVLVAPGGGPVPGRIGQPPHHRTALPHLSPVGADCIAPRPSGRLKADYAALYLEHGSAVVPHTALVLTLA